MIDGNAYRQEISIAILELEKGMSEKCKECTQTHIPCCQCEEFVPYEPNA
jgi:hypothetical protein